MQVIYIDTLFFLNATVDYLLLLSAAKVAGEPLARLRFAMGAVIGGFYAVGIFLFPFLQMPLYKVGVWLMIITIAYGNSRRLVRQGLIFLALSFAFAGGILGITLLGGDGLSLDSGVFYSSMDMKLVLLSSAFCYCMLTVVFSNYGKHSTFSGELVSVSVKISDKVIDFTSLVDTGNTLSDPVTGQSVMVVEGRILADFFTEKITPEDLFQPALFLEKKRGDTHRFRLIPYQAVGVQGLLLVMKMDEILVNHQRVPETFVALSPTSVSDGGSYQGLIGVSQTKPKTAIGV